MASLMYQFRHSGRPGSGASFRPRGVRILNFHPIFYMYLDSAGLGPYERPKAGIPRGRSGRTLAAGRRGSRTIVRIARQAVFGSLPRMILSEIRNQDILITGGAGFIGSTLAGLLVERNRVAIFDNFSRDSLATRPFRNHPDLAIIRGAMLNRRGIGATLGTYLLPALPALRRAAAGAGDRYVCRTAAAVFRESITLPLFPGMQHTDVARVAEGLRGVLDGA